jgi:sugar-specific transcriptional regulator TrmB
MEADVSRPLVKLGLTATEAQVFLAACELGGGTATEVSIAAGKERGNTHHVLQKLVKLGIVETSLDSPTTFRPLEVKDAINHLYSLQAMNLQRLDEVRKEARATLANAGLREARQTETYSIIKGRVNNYLRMVQSIQGSGKKVSLLLSSQGITRLRRFRNFLPTVAKKAEGGMEFQIITEINERNLEDVRVFGPVAEVRHVKNQFTNASIYDERTASVALSLSERLEENVMEHVALWTNGRSFVKTLADFFDSVWFVAAPAEPTIKTLGAV